MKIGFFLDNSGVADVDFSRPWEGNPGTGASEYLHVAIPYFIGEYSNEDAQCIVFAPCIEHMPDSFQAFKENSLRDAAVHAKNLGIDYFVFRPRMKEEDHILDLLDKLELPSIGRAALTPSPEHIRRMANSKAFKALVCVGREQYDFLMDTAIHDKIAYIDNGIHTPSCYLAETPQKDPFYVSYMGALVPQKGFSILARAWPKVLKKIPHAKLSIIGSAKMYDQDSKEGPLGVADEGFEKAYIIPYLTDENGKLDRSVTFHGRLGKEKFHILHASTVGIANPSGDTETCCVSAIEMAACKTPVVSGAFYAMVDTVLDGETGLLGKTDDDLANNIIRLLEDPVFASKLGVNGYQRTLEKYDFSVVAHKWVSLCQSLADNKVPQPQEKIRNLQSHYKFLRLINRPLQKVFGKLMPWPSLYEFFTYLKKSKKRKLS